MSRVGSIIVAGAAVLSTSVLFAQTPPATPAPSGPTPKIKFEATAIDLGNVVRGQDAVAEFVYKNEGNAPLKILAAKPG